MQAIPSSIQCAIAYTQYAIGAGTYSTGYESNRIQSAIANIQYAAHFLSAIYIIYHISSIYKPSEKLEIPYTCRLRKQDIHNKKEEGGLKFCI